MAWLQPESPVSSDDQEWIDRTFTWLAETVGPAGLTATVVVPTDEFFPENYGGTRREVMELVRRVARYLGFERSRFTCDDARSYDEADVRKAAPPELPDLRGHYRTREGRVFLDLGSLPDTPMLLVTTIGHEIAHGLLPTVDGPPTLDDEETVDLLLVYRGLGVFAANAAIDYAKRAYGPGARVRAGRGGHLSEELLGFALARYARLRGERRPAWAQYLDENPRLHLRRAARYLDATEGPIDE